MNARILAGIADKNASLFRRLRVPLGDPAAWIELDEETIALVRDLEMDRVRTQGLADQTTCPARHAPAEGLSADRETATAQAVVEIFRDHGVTEAVADRTLPYIYAWHLQQAGVRVDYDPELGVRDRRAKTDEEIEALAKAQSVTEMVMRQICERIAGASAAADGTLIRGGTTLTSPWIRNYAATEFMKHGFTMSHGAIVATAPEVADCHHSGNGPLRTGTPVVVDLFPRDESTRYWGDCTRSVVHGQPTDVVVAMHRAVVDAKRAAQAQLRPGITAGQVHQAAEDVLVKHGYPLSRGTITDHPSIQHGTGHGIGLDLHEPILLDTGGEEVLCGEVFTVEPGLYGRIDGGIRIEDMLVVTEDGPRNLNCLPDQLDWST